MTKLIERLRTYGGGVHRIAAADELERLTAERDALRGALAHIERVMGPAAPPCCKGCAFEWGEALGAARAALEEK